LIQKTQPFVLYFGPKNLKLILAYTPFRDLNNEIFVLVKPHDPFIIHVQIRRTHIDVVKDHQNEFFKMVRV
jgi:hypothetical protein